MPDTNDGGTAGFLGGSVNPDDRKPKEAEKAPPPPPAAAPSGNVGFLGGNGSTPTPAAPAPAPVEPAPPAQPEVPQETVPAPQQTETPAAPAPSMEPPQPMPEPAAPAIEFFSRAEELYDEGFLDSAITCYRKGLEKDPANTVAINNLSMVYIEKERYDDAQNELTRALQRGSNDPELLSNLGYVLRKQGKDMEAADVYEKYIAAAPDADDAAPIQGWIERVRTAASAPEAETVPPAAVESKPKPGPTLQVLPEAPAPAPVPPAPGSELEQVLIQAETAYEQEQYDAAIDLFAKALEIDFNSAEALAGRGRAQAKVGLHEEALASLKEAALLRPEDADTHYIIGFLLRSLGRDAEAAKSYAEFLRLAPNAENADKIRGWISEVKTATPPTPEPIAEDGKFKIDKQPAWAAALEEPPEEYANAGAPVTEATAAPEPDATVQEPEAAATFATAAAQEETAPTFAPTPDAEGTAPVGFAVQPAPETADLDAELDAIRTLLQNGDTAAGLAKAQEMVGLHPTLTAAKILIARAFGQQNEFGKAIAILKNVVAAEENDEAWFFIGRCQQELGRTREAREAFETCATITQDEGMKDRTQQLLSEMNQVEHSLCSSCGAKTPVQDLLKVQGQQLCPDCRANMEQSMGGAAQMTVDAQTTTPAKPKATRRKPSGRKRSSPLKTLAALLVFLVILGGAAFGLYRLAPEAYNTLRRKLPTALPIPQAPSTRRKAPIAKIPKGKPGSKKTGIIKLPGAVKNPVSNTQKPINPAAQFLIDSPPLTELIAGVPYRHQLHATGREPETVSYTAKLSHPPNGKYSFDKTTGVLLWQPSLQDVKAGAVTITFRAKSGEETAPDQMCEIALRPPVTVRALGPVAPVLPGEAVCLAVGDLTGDNKKDVLVARGRYWDGELILYTFHKNALRETARLRLPGRPVGLSIGNFGDGKPRALVVDYWNRCILSVRYDNGELTRMAETIDLPGRPTLTAFGNPDGKGATGVAVLMQENRNIYIFDAVAGAPMGLFRKIPLPANAPWKQMVMANLYNGTDDNEWSELALMRLGKAQPNLYLIDLKAGTEWTPLNVGAGVTQTMIADNVFGDAASSMADLTLAVGTRQPSLHLLPGREKQENRFERPLTLSDRKDVLALQTADLDGNGKKDLVLFFRNNIAFRLQTTQGTMLPLAYVMLKANADAAAPPLGPTATGDVDGDRSEDVVFLDRAGRLMTLRAPTQR